MFSLIFSLWRSSWNIFIWILVGPQAKSWDSVGHHLLLPDLVQFSCVYITCQFLFGFNFTNGALWDIGLVHCGICIYIVYILLFLHFFVILYQMSWYNYIDVIMSTMAPQITSSRLFTQPFIRCTSKKASKLRVTGLCAGNSPVTGEFPAQMTSNPENVSNWWRHHVIW